MQTLLPDWGIHAGVNEARTCLSRFTDHAAGPDVGIVWLSHGAMYPLRAPRRDGAGFGDLLVIEFALDLINRLAPRRWTERLEDFFVGALRTLGRAQVEQADADMAMVASIRSMMTEKRMDGLAVVLDAICVVASIGAVMTGVGVIGLIAFGAGIVRLSADGATFGAEVVDNDALADTIEKKTGILRVAAMVASLPDLAYGGVKLLRETGEARQPKLEDDLSPLCGDVIAEAHDQCVARCRIRADSRKSAPEIADQKRTAHGTSETRDDTASDGAALAHAPVEGGAWQQERFSDIAFSERPLVPFHLGAFMMEPSIDGPDVRGSDRLLMGCNLAALSLALIGLWVLVAVLTATDTTNAISIGGATGILIGAAGGYAQSGSGRHGWTVPVRKAFLTVARGVVWLTIVMAPLGLLANIVLVLTHCLGRSCSRDDHYMVWTGFVFTIIACALTIASWIYMLPHRRAARGGVI